MDKDKLEAEVERVRKLTPEAFAQEFQKNDSKFYPLHSPEYEQASQRQDLLLAASTDVQLIAAVKERFIRDELAPDFQEAFYTVENLWNRRAGLIGLFGLNLNSSELSEYALSEIAKSIVEWFQAHKETREGWENSTESWREGNIHKA